jgi:hypothetical protein
VLLGLQVIDTVHGTPDQGVGKVLPDRDLGGFAIAEWAADAGSFEMTIRPELHRLSVLAR